MLNISRNKGNQTMMFGQLIEYWVKYRFHQIFWCMQKFVERHSFCRVLGGLLFGNYAETVLIHKISIPGNSVKLPYFLQWNKAYETFFLKIIHKMWWKTIPRPFSKKLNWACFQINSLKFCTVSFYCMPSWVLSKYIETKLQITCLYLI